MTLGLGEVWTVKRVAAVIEQAFGAALPSRPCQSTVAQAGWSMQRPSQRAAQRDEEAITRWHEECWQAIKKAAEEGGTIVWVDESTFYLLPHAALTWTPMARPPCCSATDARPSLGISDITLDGYLLMQVQEPTFDAEDEDMVGFLRVLLRKICGKAFVIWMCPRSAKAR